MKKTNGVMFALLAFTSLITMVGCSSKSSSASKSVASKSSSVKKKSIKKKSASKSKKAQNSESKGAQKKSEAARQQSSSATVSSSSSSSQVTSNPTANSGTSSTSNSNVSQAPAKKPSTPWSQEKNQKLSAFMKQWQQSMGQSYIGTYDGQVANQYGVEFPGAIKNGDTKGKVLLNDQPVDLTWSTDGNNGSSYQIVAAASTKEVKIMGMITYLFAIHDGKPEVYYTETNNGGIIYFRNTKNQELQTGFSNIVNQ